MKKLYFLFLLLTMSSIAQTTLAPGDLVITSLLADGNDRFQFIPLVDLEAGTIIYFTESGWNATTGTWRNDDLTEGCLQYTAPSAIVRGTVITIEEDADNNDVILMPEDGSVIVTNYGNSWGISTSGDSVVAFQGTPPVTWDETTDTNPFPSPTFLYIITTHSTNWHDATSTGETAIPTGLIEGTTAVAVGAGPDSGDEFDNAYYNAITNPLSNKTQVEILALVGNPSNWIGDNSEPTGWEISNFTLSAKDFEIENLSIYPNPVFKSKRFIKVTSAVNEEMSVALFDVLGKQLTQQKILNNDVDISNLTKGVYLMKISQGSRTSIKKIIIQ